MRKDTAAVIITWNSGDEIYRSLPSIAPQVARVAVVDNGSRPEELEKLRGVIAKFSNATLIQNEKNEGIGQAMNRGGEFAKENGLKWFITLDDAAKPEPAMVEKLFSAYEALPEAARSKTAILAPNYTNLKGPVFERVPAYFVPTTVQTGQTIRVDAWEAMGKFKEDLFITGVDHEFCLRLLKGGYKTLLVPETVLEETAGPRPEIHSLLGKKFVVPNYRPDRYYYLYRNDMYIYLHYGRLVPKIILKNIISDIFSFGKILLFEEDKWKKISMSFRGIYDGITGRYGQLIKSTSA